MPPGRPQSCNFGFRCVGAVACANVLIVADSKSDTTPDDRFKVNKLSVCKESRLETQETRRGW